MLHGIMNELGNFLGSKRWYVTGSGILGLMEALVEIWVFAVFESLICLNYTGKILDLLSQNS